MGSMFTPFASFFSLIVYRLKMLLRGKPFLPSPLTVVPFLLSWEVSARGARLFCKFVHSNSSDYSDTS